MTDVAHLLQLATSAALQRQQDRYERWVSASCRVGAARIGSLLMMDVQNLGKIDVMLIEIERTFASWKDKEDHGQAQNMFFLLSNFWVRTAYSTLYAIPKNERSESVSALFVDVDHLRTTLEKYQIPKDDKIQKGIDGRNVVDLATRDGAQFEYDRADSARSIVPPVGLTEDGSVCWQIIDLTNFRSRWLSRRVLADRYLDLFDPP